MGIVKEMNLAQSAAFLFEAVAHEVVVALLLVVAA
jgi:hypothetical protein